MIYVGGEIMELKNVLAVKSALEGAVDFADEATECGEACDVDNFELRLVVSWKNPSGNKVLTATLSIQSEDYVPF